MLPVTDLQVHSLWRIPGTTWSAWMLRSCHACGRSPARHEGHLGELHAAPALQPLHVSLRSICTVLNTPYRRREPPAE